ncbi:MAG: hypothetical protein K8T25_14685 [Planctomycetia bacterium]|nr:hypothetical protein [Planctomycetia bacterium]
MHRSGHAESTHSATLHGKLSGTKSTVTPPPSHLMHLAAAMIGGVSASVSLMTMVAVTVMAVLVVTVMTMLIMAMLLMTMLAMGILAVTMLVALMSAIHATSKRSRAPEAGMPRSKLGVRSSVEAGATMETCSTELGTVPTTLTVEAGERALAVAL